MEDRSGAFPMLMQFISTSSKQQREKNDRHNRIGSDSLDKNAKRGIPAAVGRAVSSGSFFPVLNVDGEVSGNLSQSHLLRQQNQIVPIHHSPTSSSSDSFQVVNLQPKLHHTDTGKSIESHATSINSMRFSSQTQNPSKPYNDNVADSRVVVENYQLKRRHTDGMNISTGDEESSYGQRYHAGRSIISNISSNGNKNNSIFVSTPTNSLDSNSSRTSRISSFGRGSNSNSNIELLVDGGNKRIVKRKRKEYLKDGRYSSVRKVIDNLNKAVGQEKRNAAIQQAIHEFSHDNKYKHNAELYLGAANVLCVVLSMSDNEVEITTITQALEMVYRAEREAVIFSYQDVGAALVPLLLRLLERAETRKKTPAEATIENISKVLLHMTRISELRVPLLSHSGMLAALERVSMLSLNVENRVLRMRLLANLANSEMNKVTVFERSSLLESVMRIAILDKSENAREFAAAVLMDLSSCIANQVPMARVEKVLATLVKLAVVEDKMELREYAVSGIQNLAFEKRNRVQLVLFGSGVVVEALKKVICSDSNDKTRRRSAGALTNLACDNTAEKMGSHDGLLKTLAQVAVSDRNTDVQQRAAVALTKLANSITVKMSCWTILLDALIDASNSSASDGIVSAMIRIKARSDENRTSMANHPRLLETLAQLCLQYKDENSSEDNVYKDCENVTEAIAHLANDPFNHKLICNKEILAALVHGASITNPNGLVTRDAAILAMERLAMEHSNRPLMARFPGMLVTIAKATEREMNEELNGVPSSSVVGQPRLAKPLLMSLLVAM